MMESLVKLREAAEKMGLSVEMRDRTKQGIAARDTLLDRALPYLEKFTAAMEGEEPGLDDLITDIKALGSGGVSNDARNQGESADAPEATLKNGGKE